MNHEIVKVISEWRKRPKAVANSIRRGHKRVQAIVKIPGEGLATRHIDIPT